MLRAQDRRTGPRQAFDQIGHEAVPAGSSCAVGSSSTRTSVPIAMMLAIATRCCSPPESANGSRSARCVMASRSRTPSIRGSISATGIPRFSSPKASSSRTVRLRCRRADWLAWRTRCRRAREAGRQARPSCRFRRLARRPSIVARTDRGMKSPSRERERRFAGTRPSGDSDAFACPDERTDTSTRLCSAAAGISNAEAVDAERRRRFVGHRQTPVTATTTTPTLASARSSRRNRSTGGSITIR